MSCRTFEKGQVHVESNEAAWLTNQYTDYIKYDDMCKETDWLDNTKNDNYTHNYI